MSLSGSHTIIKIKPSINQHYNSRQKEKTENGQNMKQQAGVASAGGRVARGSRSGWTCEPCGHTGEVAILYCKESN